MLLFLRWGRCLLLFPPTCPDLGLRLVDCDVPHWHSCMHLMSNSLNILDTKGQREEKGEQSHGAGCLIDCPWLCQFALQRFVLRSHVCGGDYCMSLYVCDRWRDIININACVCFRHCIRLHYSLRCVCGICCVSTQSQMMKWMYQGEDNIRMLFGWQGNIGLAVICLLCCRFDGQQKREKKNPPSSFISS